MCICVTRNCSKNSSMSGSFVLILLGHVICICVEPKGACPRIRSSYNGICNAMVVLASHALVLKFCSTPILIDQGGVEHCHVESPSSVSFSVSGRPPEGVLVSPSLLAFEPPVPVYEARFLLQMFELFSLKGLAGGP